MLSEIYKGRMLGPQKMSKIWQTLGKMVTIGNFGFQLLDTNLGNFWRKNKINLKTPFGSAFRTKTFGNPLWICVPNIPFGSASVFKNPLWICQVFEKNRKMRTILRLRFWSEMPFGSAFLSRKWCPKNYSKPMLHFFDPHSGLSFFLKKSNFCDDLKNCQIF